MASEGWCKHFNGVQFPCCKAGVNYDAVTLSHEAVNGQTRSLPCLVKYNVGGANCPKREEYTEAELQAEREATARMTRLLADGKSACCESPLDTSAVIRDGRHKGHGPRYCSACGKVVLIV